MDSTSPNSFNELFLQHQRDVYAYIVTLVPNRTDADDVFQQTCLKLLEKQADFDTRRGFFPWACGFALNEVRRFRRMHHRERTQLDDAAVELLANVQFTSAHRIEERLGLLMDCLAALPAEKQQLLMQSYGYQGGFQEFAGLLQIEPNALYKRLERIRRTLFECMEKDRTPTS